MFKDLDRNQRRVLSRMWTEIKVRQARRGYKSGLVKGRNSICFGLQVTDSYGCYSAIPVTRTRLLTALECLL
jgi:hypothetical protein